MQLLDYHRRNSIPSMVLALVTLLLTAYSFCLVQPNIKRRYRDIVIVNFQLLDLMPGELVAQRDGRGSLKAESSGEDSRQKLENALEPESVVGGSKASVQRFAGERGTAERLRVLEQTQLCLRRLIISDRTDDAVRFQSGQVLELLGEWYLDSARAKAAKDRNSEGVGSLLALARAERQKAFEAMRAAQKLNGPFAEKTSLWLARRKLFDNLELPTDDLNSLADQVALIVDRQQSATFPVAATASGTEPVTNSASVTSDTVISDGLVASDSTVAFARQLLGKIRVLQAFSCRNERSNSERLKLLQEADKLLGSIENFEMEMIAWAAEAAGALKADASRDTANRALQAYWSNRDKSVLSPELLASVFRCFLLIDSTKEGQLFLSEQLQQISAIDQPRFRALSAAAAIRQLVLKAIWVNKDATIVQQGKVESASDFFSILSMAVQLQPDSSELLSLLERFAKVGGDDELIVALESVMGLSGEADSGVKALGADGKWRVPATVEVGLKSFLAAINGLGSGDLDKSREDALVASIEASPAFGVAASRLAIRMNGSSAVSSELAIRWLKTINDAVPDVLVAWSDRANVHLKEKQFQQAIECYEFLLKKLPGNEQISQALEAAKKQSQL